VKAKLESSGVQEVLEKSSQKSIDVAGNLTFFCDILITKINCLKANNYVGYTLICLLNCIEIIV